MKKKLLASLWLCFSFMYAIAADGAAKYVFFFIGDGMGVNQVNGTEMYKGELQGKIGTEPLLFTSFPYAGFSKTYSQSNSITDSAAGGTALAVGEKTKNGTIGMDYTHTKSLESVAEKAHRHGKRVGIATSVSVDHATPASFYAHQPSRKMYYEIGTDLAKSGFEFFAGSDFLSPDNKAKQKTQNLFTIVQDSGYIVTRGMKEFNKKQADADKIILFQEAGKDKSSLPFAIDRKTDDLTLSEITESAIQFLDKDNKGFFVMIEGGKIDWSSHSNDVATTFREVMDMDEAIQKAYAFYQAHPDSTLIVVTADHETGGLALGRHGYDLDLKLIKDQKLSQTALSSALGEWRKQNKGNISWEKMQAFLKQNLGFWDTIKLTPEEEEELKDAYEDTYKKDSEKVKSEYANDEELASQAIEILNQKGNVGWTTKSHSAAYVPVFAIGAGADQFVGVMENTDIPKKIAKAAGY
ncbi:MAG: alkaline phosphatase [Bacteroidales bacterium]